MYFSTRLLFATIDVTDYDDGFPGYDLCVHERGLTTDNRALRYRLRLLGQLTQPDVLPESRYTTSISADIAVVTTASVLLDAVEAAVSSGRFAAAIGGDVYFQLREIQLCKDNEQSPLIGSVNSRVVKWGLSCADVTTEINRLDNESAIERSWDNYGTADRLRQQARELAIANSFSATELHVIAQTRSIRQYC